MHPGNTGLKPLDAGAVMDGVEQAGNQINRLAQAEIAHIPQGKLRLRAAKQRPVEHRLIDIQSAALVARIKKMAHMRPRPTGQIQMPFATVTEQLLQPLNTLALRPVVDIRAH